MVVENLQTTPLLEWLLGPGWYDAALFQPLTLAVVGSLFALVAIGLFLWLRRAPVVVSPRASAILGTVTGSLVVILAVPALACMFFQKPYDACAKAIAPIAGQAEWLLGPAWHTGVLYRWFAALTCLGIMVFVIGWLFATLRRGPGAATVRSGQVLAETLLDLVRISPRRVLGLTRLAVQESIRRRVVVVFIVFLLLLLFAGWFLNPGSDQPARLYLQFVLSWTSYLTLLLVWIVSALSLPADIKDRTLYTIVTKPVRQTEIILGRLLGFIVVGTVLLAGMCLVSYVFTIRGLNHTHELTPAMLQEQAKAGSDVPVKKGLTSLVHGHQHEVTVAPSGEVVVEMKQGHWHDVTVDGSGDKTVYRLGSPEGRLVARVPMYGKLSFKDRAGKDVDRGICVGDEWTYRSFIEGSTKAAAIWSFTGITEDQFPTSMFPDAIPIEMTIEVFRSHKGDVEKPIMGSLSLRNPKTGHTVEVRNFWAKKFATDVQWIPRKLVSQHGDSDPVTLDLFRDVVSDDGRLEIWVQCNEAAQFFGMAQPDLYFRAHDASFVMNFAKGYLGIWLQMVLVVGIGVMFSTFVSGPVAMIGTLGTVLAGLFSAYMVDLATGKVFGGGPFEAFLRLVNQQNLVQELDQGLPANAALMGDHAMRAVLWLVSSALPAFDNFDFTDYVAYGFDVGPVLVLKCLLRVGAFLLPVFVLSYLFLRLREVAK